MWLVMAALWTVLAVVHWVVACGPSPGNAALHGDVCMVGAVLMYLVAKVESLVDWWMNDTEVEETRDVNG